MILNMAVTLSERREEKKTAEVLQFRTCAVSCASGACAITNGMKLTETDIDEFLALASKEGVDLTRKEAAEAATRLLLLYVRLSMPTPAEFARHRLAKPVADASLNDGRKPNQLPTV
jgi:hypothetical protein